MGAKSNSGGFMGNQRAGTPGPGSYNMGQNSKAPGYSIGVKFGGVIGKAGVESPGPGQYNNGERSSIH